MINTNIPGPIIVLDDAVVEYRFEYYRHLIYCPVEYLEGFTNKDVSRKPALDIRKNYGLIKLAALVPAEVDAVYDAMGNLDRRNSYDSSHPLLVRLKDSPQIRTRSDVMSFDGESDHGLYFHSEFDREGFVLPSPAVKAVYDKDNNPVWMGWRYQQK